LKIVFARLEKDSKGQIVEEVRHWTAQEFKQLEFKDTAVCSRMLDKKAKKEVSGVYRVKSIDEENVINLSAKDVVATVKREHGVKVKKAPGCRSVDHKRLERTDRSDVLKIVFARLDKDSNCQIVEEVRHWTAKEFKQLEFNNTAVCSRMLDEKAKSEVSGLYKVKSIDEKNVVNLSAKRLVATVERKHGVKVQKPIGKQVEIYVVHIGPYQHDRLDFSAVDAV